MRSLFFTPKPEDVPEEPVSDRQPKENRGDSTPDKHIKARRTKNVHFDRRIKSELHLEECLPWHFEKGASYHCISHGDVDSPYLSSCDREAAAGGICSDFYLVYGNYRC